MEGKPQSGRQDKEVGPPTTTADGPRTTIKRKASLMAAVTQKRRGYAKPWRARWINESGVRTQRSFTTEQEAIDFLVSVGQPLRTRNLHPTAIDRVLARVRINDSGCWEFTGNTGNNGYGTITYGGRGSGTHRVSYEHFVAAIPDGFQIDHLCRNHSCCNPDHLEAVTQAENLRREHLVRAAERVQS